MTDTASNRPLPVPDEASRPFFDAAARGMLLIKQCPTCNRHLAPSAEACDLCFSEAIDWAEAIGRGTLYSYVVVHQAFHAGFAQELPYTVIVVELEEGPRLHGNYRGEDQPGIGMALRVGFEPAGDVTVPVWYPA